MVGQVPTLLLFVVLVPFLAWDAVRFAHRLVGPLVRFSRAMEIAGGLCFTGALVAFVTIRRGATLPVHRHPSLQHGCVELRAGS